MRPRMRFRTRKGNGADSMAGRVGMTLFGLLFGSFGLFMTVMAARDAAAQLATRRWVPAPCTIDRNVVTDHDDGYRFQVAYRYSFAGRTHDSTRWRRGSDRFRDVATRARLECDYAAGRTVTCYVDPASPGRAVLEPAASVTGAFAAALFCSLFAFVGYGLVALTWMRRRRRPDTLPAPVTAAPTAGARMLVVLGVAFAGIGLSVTYATFVRPLRLQLAARHWVPAEATVTRSMVRVHRGEDRSTYSVYIAYRYRFEDREYAGDRFRFTGGSSSGRGSKQAIVAAHPPGSTLTVFVDPAAPQQSVIERDAGRAILVGLIPLVFALVGAGLLIGGIRSGRRPSESRTSGSRVQPPGRAGPPMRRSAGPAVRIFGVLFALLFWNGIVSVFATHCVQEWRHGRHPVFLSLFLIPFVLVGLGLVGAFVYQILRLANPRVVFETPNRPLHPGASQTLGYRIEGKAGRLQRLIITLTGREAATYQRGTNSTTDTRDFFTHVLSEQAGPLATTSGFVRIEIPSDAMHSFRSAHNRVEWVITVKGEVPRWPDVSETYTLHVRPQEAHT